MYAKVDAKAYGIGQHEAPGRGEIQHEIQLELQQLLRERVSLDIRMANEKYYYYRSIGLY